MTLADVMRALADLGSPTTKRTLLRHGASEPLFGVRIGDLKPLQRQLRGRQDLALELFATGNSDAMYLAGLIAAGGPMSPAQLNAWARSASWHMIASCPVAWVAAEHAHAIQLALRWIDDRRALTVIAGWSTLAALVTCQPDAALPLPEIRSLLDRCARTIHQQPDRVRYAMNHFVICCGTYFAPLAEEALATADRMGQVNVDMGDTASKVPDARTAILKARRGQPVAPKRKTVRC